MSELQHFTATNGLPGSINQSAQSTITVVCLHGNSTDIRIWEPLQQASQGKVEIMAIALPGHSGHQLEAPISFDEAAIMIHEAMCERLISLRRCYILGASLGGHLAVQIAHYNESGVPAQALRIEGVYTFGSPLNFDTDLPQFVPDPAKNPDITTVLEQGLLFQAEPFTEEQARLFSACQGPPDEHWLNVMTDAAHKTSRYARLISKDLFVDSPRNEVERLSALLSNNFHYHCLHGKDDAAVSLNHIEAEFKLLRQNHPQQEIHVVVLNGSHSLALTNVEELFKIFNLINQQTKAELDRIDNSSPNYGNQRCAQQ